MDEPRRPSRPLQEAGRATSDASRRRCRCVVVTPAVTVRGLVETLRHTRALDGLHLEAARGEVHGLLDLADRSSFV